ncbi:hypothetical protein EC991_005064 [Linnemannia zychae]|nr:hypothetical protein EC991_005064 [Linnemannia zychae]
MATSTTSAAVCGTVLDIQELQDMIRCHLTTKDLKACTLVCQQWNRHFDPHLWHRVTIWKKGQKRPLLKRHGMHVKDMSCLYFDKSTLKAVLRHCPNIEHLYIRLDQKSMWIQYKHLESLFIRLQDQLTNLHILFDAAFFEPAFLWSMNRLTRLTHLRVDPHFLEDRDPSFSPPEYYTSLLECCPTLRTLKFYYGPYFGGELEDERWTQNAFKKWIRGILDPRRQDRLPSSPIDAITRRAGTSVGGGGSAHRINPEMQERLKPGSPIPQQFNLRSLQLQPPVMNLPTFLAIARQSPSMESLALGGQWGDFHLEIWTELSTLCPHLRELEIKFYGKIKDFPTIATFVTLFPRLESISLVRQLLDKDPDLSTLGDSLRRHKQLYGSPHPFKSLEITGTIRQQFPIIVDTITLPVALESFKIGNIIRHSRFLETDPPPPIPSPAKMLELTTASWPCHVSLTTLDISSVIFPDKATTFQFFGRLQDFTRLRTLHFWLFHLRDMICHVDSIKVQPGDADVTPLDISEHSSGDEDVPPLDLSDSSSGDPNTPVLGTGINININNNHFDGIDNSNDNIAISNSNDDIVISNAIFANNNFSSSSISLQSLSSSSSADSHNSSNPNPSSTGNIRIPSLTLTFPTIQRVQLAPVFEMLRSGLGPAITMHEARLLINAMPSMVQFDLSSCAGTLLEVARLQREYPALKIRH